jgi:hypothetical protein
MAEEQSDEIAFPDATVRAAILECWEMETKETKLPRSGDGQPGSIMDPLIEIDSHGIVRCFVAISKATDIEIPETEAKDEGYHSLEELLANLVPLAQKYFEQQKAKIAKRKKDNADSSVG